MSDKALYVLAGYDDKTEKYLSNIQNKLYECGFTGTHTKHIPQHITLVFFEALPFVMNEFTAFSGEITSLHLYEFFPTRHILSVDFE